MRRFDPAGSQGQGVRRNGGGGEFMSLRNKTFVDKTISWMQATFRKHPADNKVNTLQINTLNTQHVEFLHYKCHGASWMNACGRLRRAWTCNLYLTTVCLISQHACTIVCSWTLGVKCEPPARFNRCANAASIEHANITLARTVRHTYLNG